MDAEDYDVIKLHAHNSSQRRADGADAYAENARYDYLEGKNNMSIAEGFGYRSGSESGGGSTRYERNPPKGKGNE